MTKLLKLNRKRDPELPRHLSCFFVFLLLFSVALAKAEVYVEDYGAIANDAVDDSGAIQDAIDSGASVIKFKGGATYIVEYTIYVSSGVSLVGEGSGKTIILKTTATAGAGSNLSRNGSVTDSYSKNAILVVTHSDNNYAYNVNIKGIRFKGDNYIVEYGIYAPRISHCILEDVYIMQCKYSFVTHDAWLNTFVKVIANANSVDPAGVPAIASSSYGHQGAVGFWFKDDGSSSATGTSLNAIGCWARDCHRGWDIYGLQYSTLNSCASDNITSAPYHFELSKITMNGCGNENSVISNGSYFFSYSTVVMNGCQSHKITGTSGTSGGLYLDHSSVTVNECTFEDFLTVNSAYNMIIQNSSKLINNGSVFPTNGNSYVSYSNASSRTDLGDSYIKISDANSVRYLTGRIGDRDVIEKANKIISSSGTTICTLTDSSGGSGVKMASVRLKITWVDATYPSGMGTSDVQVVVYKDSGTNYRQSINTSLNTAAGNGLTIPPAYTLSRNGDVWSVVMTPAHGSSTCKTITCDVENYSEISVELP